VKLKQALEDAQKEEAAADQSAATMFAARV